MKKLKYVGPSGTGVDIEPPDGGKYTTDESGVAEVPDEVAKSLLQQDVWQAVPKSDQKKED